MPHKFLPHTADVKFLASGQTLENAFTSAADALNETIRGDIKILSQHESTFEVQGKDLENLLYNFLEEFLFLLDAQDFLTAEIKEISIDQVNFQIKCTVIGDKAVNYKFTNDVKAITYNDMFVKQNKKGTWQAQAVLDV
jgi:SHS2 domain-containing protein